MQRDTVASMTGRNKRSDSGHRRSLPSVATEAGRMVEPRPSSTAALSAGTDSISDATSGVTRARDRASSIRRRSRWLLLGSRSWHAAQGRKGQWPSPASPGSSSPRRRDEKHLLTEERLKGHALHRIRRIDERHVHLAGHDQLAQDMPEAVIDVDDDPRMLEPSSPSAAAAKGRSSSNRSQARWKRAQRPMLPTG